MDELNLPALLASDRSGQLWTSIAALLLWLIVDRASRLGARQRADDSGLLRRQA